MSDQKIKKEELNQALKEYVFSNKIKGVKETLELGADPNQMMTSKRKSKLSMQMKKGMSKRRKEKKERGTQYLIHKAVLNNNYQMVKELLEKGADKHINFMTKKCGNALNCVVKFSPKTSDSYKIFKLLLEYGGNPFCFDNNGLNTFFYAEKQSNKDKQYFVKGEQEDRGRYLGILNDYRLKNTKKMAILLNNSIKKYRFE
tara:strand:- start:1921 stop:2523 length:603 start_codon:yes stop_codon:yes gene_type:complete